MDLEHQQKLYEMNRQFENLMNHQRLIETESFLKQLEFSHDIEMKKMEEEKNKI